MMAQTDALFTLAGAFLTLFFIALRNAWRLVVRAGHEPARGAG
jgi:hypothetical protein